MPRSHTYFSGYLFSPFICPRLLQERLTKYLCLHQPATNAQAGMQDRWVATPDTRYCREG